MGTLSSEAVPHPYNDVSTWLWVQVYGALFNSDLKRQLLMRERAIYTRGTIAGIGRWDPTQKLY